MPEIVNNPVGYLPKTVRGKMKIKNQIFEFQYIPDSIKTKLKKNINITENLIQKTVTIPDNTNITFSFDLYLSQESIEEKKLKIDDKAKDSAKQLLIAAGLSKGSTVPGVSKAITVASNIVSATKGILDMSTGVMRNFGEENTATAQEVGFGEESNKMKQQIKQLTDAYIAGHTVTFESSFGVIASAGGTSERFIIQDINIEWLNVREDLHPTYVKISMTFINAPKGTKLNFTRFNDENET